MKDLTLRIDSDRQISKPIEIESRFDQKRKDKIASAAKQFESLLTSMMLKSMNQTTNGMFGGDNGYGGDMFESIFEQKIASEMSESHSLGIAKLLYKKITGEEMSSEMQSKISTGLDSIKGYLNAMPADATKFQPNKTAIDRLNKYERHIDDAANEFGVDKNIIKSIILTESAANNKAVSSANAKGLMQLMDSTVTDLGVNDVFNPRENIFGGTKYFARMLRQYSGDLKLALAAYNAGPQNVEKFNGVPPFDETKNYINKVLTYLDHFKESGQ